MADSFRKMKKVSSQVFDEAQNLSRDTQEEIVTGVETLSQQKGTESSSSATPAPAATLPANIDSENQEISNIKTRRKSSWAFWSSDNGTEVASLNTEEIDINAIRPDTVESIDNKITNEENLNAESKQRSYSWTFWSTKNSKPEDLKSTENDMPNEILQGGSLDSNQLLDAVKTPVTKSSEVKHQNKTIVKKRSSKFSMNLPNKSNLVTPKIEETLPLFGTHTMIFNGYKRMKKALGYFDSGELYLHRKIEAKIFKRVLIIGVHGFFPTRMIRPIIGEPTGTSMKFAQVGETAVLQWAKENNMNVEIQKIALEKEGKIFDRVDFFFDILKNSANDIRKADFIFVCAHSQGTPVGVMLISKLLEYGIIDKNKMIGILGMAGINIGPFFGMDKTLFLRAYSAIENASLLELFQFQNFESLQSRKYMEALRNLVAHDVKITFVGSIDDQLVPLYSSTASHIHHPNIFKSVYIDGSTNTPDFVARIVKLSCQLQNIGFTDHGVVREISHALAGPLTGGGHSKIYNDLQVYKMALDFTLKTESSVIAIQQPLKFKPFDIKKFGINSNPYNLPWCARGMFFEVLRKIPHGDNEIEMVFKEFTDWQPESKILKDVKYRLNGIKAQL
ncbi:hypothetical protein DAMA08_034680 [Martiniozyma asiatica (nom. inval.)]|nr:hypothetical protein DAMA08_034680 [Martiniozyma asiatica]